MVYNSKNMLTQNNQKYINLLNNYFIIKNSIVIKLIDNNILEITLSTFLEIPM